MNMLYTVVSVWHSYTLSYVVYIILRDIYDSVYTVCTAHRRRITSEEKAAVVTAAWGGGACRIDSFLCRAIL